MNVSGVCQDPSSPITKKRIKTWYVEFIHEVTSEVSDVTDYPDFDISQSNKKILDAADKERNILTLGSQPAEAAGAATGGPAAVVASQWRW